MPSRALRGSQNANDALNGQTREETDRYLAENFDLSDRAGLLDEVYATVEG